MDWSSVKGIATTLLSGNWIAILTAVLVAVSLPLLLHHFLYRSSSAKLTNDFLLLGPSGSGKTAFCSLLERKSTASPHPVRETHTTQSSAYFTALLPADVKTKSDRYRSVNDPTLTEASRNTVRYRVYDTPGHGKLRAAQGIAQLRSTSDPKNPKTNARGIIYMLDAANLSENDYLRDTATYLHDILLVLQQRVYKGGSLRNKKIPKTPVLVAANKLDLFTALPVETITEKLETEIERYRQSKRRGLLDASVNPATADEEPEILGTDEGLGRFSFKSLAEEVGVTVEVVGGAVNSEDSTNPAAGIRSWEEWIASCL